MRRLRTLARLPRAEALLLLRAGAALALVDLALRLLPFSTVEAFLAGRGRGAPRAAGGEAPVAQAVDVAGRHLAHSCLTRALTLRWLLSRRGIHTRLCLGVRRDGAADGLAPAARLQAHAWLEHDGRAVIGTRPENYAPLAFFEGGPRRSTAAP